MLYKQVKARIELKWNYCTMPADCNYFQIMLFQYPVKF